MLKLGIIGHPIGHTLSPKLHGILLAAAGLEGDYEAYDIEEAALVEALSAFRETGFRGLNVTIPHKQAVIPHCDVLTPAAKQIGAVNTLIFEGDQLIGGNSDVAGFAKSLPQQVVERLPDSQVLVLGAGGAARAVMAALIEFNTAQVVVATRSPEKGLVLLAAAEAMKGPVASITGLGLAAWDELGDLEAFTGVVNTTPVGMFPDTEASPLNWGQLQGLPAGSWVYDLVYRPLETRLLRDARIAGVDVIPGMGMLIHQGVASFERWSGKTVSLQTVAKLFAALTEA